MAVKGVGGSNPGSVNPGANPGVGTVSNAPATGALTLDQFIQVSVAAAAKATKDLPGGPHPIWIGIIIRPPDIEVLGKTNK